MPSYTDRWGLSILGPGDTLQSDGFKFTDADRRLIDRLLTYAAEQHRHTGLTADDLTPSLGLALTLDTTGTLPAGTRYYYRYTVLDEYGNQSAPSPVAHIDTPPTIPDPGAPTLIVMAGSGDLEPGGYSYVVSAWKGSSTEETRATASAFVKIPGGTASNSIGLILPSLPLGADGLNVYRKPPSGLNYLHLLTTTDVEIVDDGTVAPDANRTLPSSNRTGAVNSIVVSLPGDPPALANGVSWRVYRTTDPANWNRSELLDIGPIGEPPVLPTEFTDTGLAVQIGGPPATPQTINAPSKIVLTDGEEVEGSLPPGLLVAPNVLTFVAAPGPVYPAAGTYTWICDYDLIVIVHCRAYLGVGSVPAAQDVIVDVNAYRPSIDQDYWESIYDGPSRPTVPVGESVGEPSEPPDLTILQQGDALQIDIDQAGGGATPTDLDLSLNVLMYVKDGSETESYPWLTP